ncbi:MAG: DUF2207 domain-containing protein [Crocinitomicaceae bacterium]
MKFLIIFLICFVGLKASAEYEHILTYHSDLKVQKSTEVVVTETIKVYAAGYDIKRGIYRELPLSYIYEGGNYHVGFELLEVLKDGKPEAYHTKWRSNGIAIYIGSEEVFLPEGYYTYTIKYRVDNVLGYFDDRDEFYWNINGAGWDFIIDSVSATVHLPEGAELVAYTAYTGGYGESGSDYIVHEDGTSVFFKTTKPLYSRENLTVSVGWSKGAVSYPTGFDKFIHFLKTYAILFAVLVGVVIGFVFNFISWHRYGRDPKPGVIIPRYYAPEGFSPAECAYLDKEGRSTNEMFGAQLVGLAVKGVVEIEQKEQKGIFGDTNYIITRLPLDKAKKPLNDIEEAFYDRIFGSKDLMVIKDGKYNARVASAYKLLDARLDKKQDKVYYLRNNHLKAKQFLPLLLTVGLGTLAYWFYGGLIPMIIVGGVLHLVLNIIFNRLYEQPTNLGRQKMDEIDGFKMYMKYADVNRIKALNPPDLSFDHFEENLPFAIALGLAKEWQRKFDPVMIKEQMPSRMGYFHGVSAAHFATFSSNLSTAISSAATPPGSGGSSSSGGGFSGGGGGGGGGGGW